MQAQTSQFNKIGKTHFQLGSDVSIKFEFKASHLNHFKMFELKLN